MQAKKLYQTFNDYSSFIKNLLRNNHKEKKMKSKKLTQFSVCLLFMFTYVFLITNATHAFRKPDEPLSKKTESKMTSRGAFSTVSPERKSNDIRRLDKRLGLSFVQFEDLNMSISNDHIEQKVLDIVNRLTTNSIFKIDHVMKDTLGFQHIRLTQHYNNIPVFGGEIIAHINNKNQLYQINGKYIPTIDISNKAILSENIALRKGMNRFISTFNLSKDRAHMLSKPSKVVFGNTIAYRFNVANKAHNKKMREYFIDAYTSEILLECNSFMYDDLPSGTHETIQGLRLETEGGEDVSLEGLYGDDDLFYMVKKEKYYAVYDLLEDKYENNPDYDWKDHDRAAISTGFNISTVQHFFQNTLKYQSFDNKGTLAKLFIHEDMVNAYWDPQKMEFHFGDGDESQNIGPLCSMDIVAHEFGHAFTQYSSNLYYQSESGALNESFSDIIGFTAEYLAQEKSFDTYSPGKADWLMGEDIFLNNNEGEIIDKAEAIRDMKDPQRFDQPSYYFGTNWYEGFEDNGGVHINNGVQNFAFYLLAVGGEGSNDGHHYKVKGIGIEDASRIAIRANQFYLTSASCYSESRKAWISSAKDLNLDISSVVSAWDAVGVNEYSYMLDQEMDPANSNGYLSQQFDSQNESKNTFLADDFELSYATRIQVINVPGTLWNNDKDESLHHAKKLHFIIFNDNQGKPDGNPFEADNAIMNLSLDPDDSQVSITNGVHGLKSNVTLNLNETVSLQPGKYWIVFYPEIDYATGEYGRHVSSTTNGSVAQICNFTNNYTWESIQEHGINYHDLAFNIYGMRDVSSDWEETYEKMFDSQHELYQFRAYRDKVLSKSSSGKLYRRILYKCSKKALQTFLDHPKLLIQARNLIDFYHDDVLKVLEGKPASLKQSNRIIQFLDDYADHSSFIVKMLTKMVKREMIEKKRNQTAFCGFSLQ